MANVQDLETLANQRHPVTEFAGQSLLEQLKNGFVATKTAMFKHISAGQTLDYETARIAVERARIQVEQNYDVVRTALERGEDLPRAYALALSVEELRSYFLAKYTLACEGIGAYLSGYMKDAADRGTITRADYDEGIELRLNAFGTLVGMDEQGELRNVLQPEASAATVMRTISTAASSSPPIVFLESKKQTVYVAPPIARPGASGLGLPPPLIVAIIGICAVLVVAVIAAGVNRWHKDAMAAQLARERCLEADKYGYAETIKWCNNYASGVESNLGVLEDILGQKTINTLAKYATIAAVAYVGLLFAPEIIRGFRDTAKASRQLPQGG